MSIEFRLPDVGEGLAEAEIVAWLVEVGGAVVEDQAIVQIETDKALVEITSPVTGTLVRQAVPAGTVLPVGEVLAVFEASGAAAPAASAPAAAPAASAAPAAPVPSAPAAAPVAVVRPDGERPKATPSTRGLARRLGVDLATVAGSGPGGRITAADVEAAAGRGVAPATAPAATAPAATAPAAPRAAAPPLPPIAPPDGEDRVVPVRGLRRTIARNMTTAWTTVPHVNSVHEVDLHELQHLRAQLRLRGREVPVTAFLIRAAALALREFPVLNATIDMEKEEMVLLHRVNIGVAVDAPDGLIVPVIHDADRKDVVRLGHELRELAELARARTVPQDRLRGGTFTVNNYGPLGGWFGTSLVKPPEVGILSMGPAREQVVARDGQVVIRPVAGMVLAADHRVADGREIIGFCVAVRRLLEAPVNLVVAD